MIIPVVNPIISSENIYVPNVSGNYIETHAGYFVNINLMLQCGVYQSDNKWWIWFRQYNGSTSYYLKDSFKSNEEALNALKKIVNIIEMKEHRNEK